MQYLRESLVWGPSTETNASRYCTQLRHFILISLFMPLALFVISLFFSPLLSILYLCAGIIGHFNNGFLFLLSPARACISLANSRFVIFPLPTLTLQACFSRASDMIRARKISKSLGDSLTPTVVMTRCSPMLPFVALS